MADAFIVRKENSALIKKFGLEYLMALLNTDMEMLYVAKEMFMLISALD